MKSGLKDKGIFAFTMIVKSFCSKPKGRFEKKMNKAYKKQGKTKGVK